MHFIVMLLLSQSHYNFTKKSFKRLKLNNTVARIYTSVSSVNNGIESTMHNSHPADLMPSRASQDYHLLARHSLPWRQNY